MFKWIRSLFSSPEIPSASGVYCAKKHSIPSPLNPVIMEKSNADIINRDNSDSCIETGRYKGVAVSGEIIAATGISRYISGMIGVTGACKAWVTVTGVRLFSSKKSTGSSE